MTPAIEQLMQRVTTLFENYVKLQQSLNYETIIASVRMDEPAKLSDTIAANLQIGIEEKQELLAIFDPAARLARIADVLDVEIEKLDLDRNIQSRVKRQMERAQKEYYLNEKINAIQKELGRGEKVNSTSCARKLKLPACPRTSSTRPFRSSKSSKPCRPCQPSPPSAAITLTGCWPCHGKSGRRKRAPSTMPKKFSTPTTTASRKSKNASSNFSPCASWSRIPRAPFCVS